VLEPRSGTGPNELRAEDFRRLVEAIPGPLVALSADGVVRYAAPALGLSLGQERGALEGATLDALVHPEDLEALHRATDPGAEGRSQTVRLRRRDGTWKVHEVVGGRFVDSAGVWTTVLQCRDTSPRAARTARGADRHDPMTGLPNRASFVDRLDRTMGRAQRTPDHLFAVLCVGLDPYVTAGEGGNGEARMVKIASRLTDTVRPHDTVAHVGRDEFSVLVDRLQASEDALRVAERIHRALGNGGEKLAATASIGVTVSGEGYDHGEDLLRDADAALSRAKAAGNSRTELFDPAMDARARARLKLESDLRAAVEEDQFVVHYQPVVELRSGRVAGFEALVRWHHPARGLISPGEFIPIAEETGLIVAICASVLRLACGQARAWQDLFHSDPPLFMSMNFTTSQFTQGAVMDAVVSALQGSGLDGRQLVMEIKESVAAQDIDGVIAVLDALKTLGVAVHIDDFGTGYSSLSYLHRLPADALKIDRSFMRRMEDDPDAALLVGTIADVAHGLGLRVVAEGIETEAQLARARGLGCEYGQGFYFARPMPADAVGMLLARDPRW
jgi:diguanylate cyclase (GGDEF)-like protein/PAS domain S-box-containing protein